MFGTYRPGDVTLLLKDITGLVEPLDAPEREKRIQAGVHYCEMLPLEYEPSKAYMEAFERALALYAPMTAAAVEAVSQRLCADLGPSPVLVSLARAGTPIGVLIRHCIARMGGDAPHYSVSIIRGRGIDRNAMRYILSRHDPERLAFVDGWTGKGAILRQLTEAVADVPGVRPALAVLSDPARISTWCGTHDDFLIASSCLNSTVSGLLSRTFLRADIIGPGDFHGAAFYSELRDRDLTYRFIDAVEACFGRCAGALPPERPAPALSPGEELDRIREGFGIRDLNLVKPGIGEATRVLLRRLPWRVLVHSLNDEAHLGHLYRLAAEKGVVPEEYPLTNYRAVGLIRDLADN